MPSPESDAIGFNSEILFQALNATPFVLVVSTPPDGRGRGWFESNKVKVGFQCCCASHRALSMSAQSGQNIQLD